MGPWVRTLNIKIPAMRSDEPGFLQDHLANLYKLPSLKNLTFKFGRDFRQMYRNSKSSWQTSNVKRIIASLRSMNDVLDKTKDKLGGKLALELQFDRVCICMNYSRERFDTNLRLTLRPTESLEDVADQLEPLSFRHITYTCPICGQEN